MRLKGYYYGFDRSANAHIVHVLAWEPALPGTRGTGQTAPREVQIPFLPDDHPDLRFGDPIYIEFGADPDKKIV